MSWCDLDVTFVLAVVTLSYNILSGYISATVRCRKFLLGMSNGWGCRCATSWCNLDLTFNFVVVSMTFNILSRQYL